MRPPNPKVNGYKNAGRLAALNKRRERAKELLAARDERSDMEQLITLEKRPGRAARERDRLWARISPTERGRVLYVGVSA